MGKSGFTCRCPAMCWFFCGDIKQRRWTLWLRFDPVSFGFVLGTDSALAAQAAQALADAEAEQRDLDLKNAAVMNRILTGLSWFGLSHFCVIYLSCSFLMNRIHLSHNFLAPCVWWCLICWFFFLCRMVINCAHFALSCASMCASSATIGGPASLVTGSDHGQMKGRHDFDIDCTHFSLLRLSNQRVVP